MKKNPLLLIVFLFILSNSCIGQDKYYISFCAKDLSVSTPFGHAFVSYGKEDYKKQACTIENWGFGPKDNFAMLTLIGNIGFAIVPGAIKSNLKIKADYVLTKEVDFSTYNNALALKEKWTGKGYALTLNDCVTYLMEVAQEVAKTVSGFTVPPRSGKGNFPAIYIQELIASNKVDNLTGKWICHKSKKNWICGEKNTLDERNYSDTSMVFNIKYISDHFVLDGISYVDIFYWELNKIQENVYYTQKAFNFGAAGNNIIKIKVTVNGNSIEILAEDFAESSKCGSKCTYFCKKFKEVINVSTDGKEKSSKEIEENNKKIDETKKNNANNTDNTTQMENMVGKFGANKQSVIKADSNTKSDSKERMKSIMKNW